MSSNLNYQVYRVIIIKSQIRQSSKMEYCDSISYSQDMNEFLEGPA